jgi:hypothetical protein
MYKEKATWSPLLDNRQQYSHKGKQIGILFNIQGKTDRNIG